MKPPFGYADSSIALKARVLDLENKDKLKSDGFYGELGNCMAVDIEMFVDKRRLGERGYVDIVALNKSRKQGQHLRNCLIFNCGCGFPGCLCPDDGMEITHRGDLVQWAFSTSYAEWLGVSTYLDSRALLFRRADVCQQYLSLWEEFKQLCRGDFDRIRLPTHDLPLGDLAKRFPGLVPE